MTRDTLRQVTNVLAVAVTIAVNVLANTLPLGGNTTGELAERYPVAIQPAGYAFSIWSLIYLGLMAYAIFQALPGQRHNSMLRRIGWLAPLTGAANVSWLLLWHFEHVSLSLVPMLVLLAALTGVYLLLDSGHERHTVAERLLVVLPFSVYLGWITVASVVNAAVVLYDLDTGQWLANRTIWNVVLLAAAGLFAGVVVLRRADIAYGLVIAWACAAIIANDPGHQPVALLAGLLAIAAPALAVAARWLPARARAGLAP